MKHMIRDGGPTHGIHGHDVKMMMTMDGWVDDDSWRNWEGREREREVMITNGVMMPTPPSVEIND